MTQSSSTPRSGPAAGIDSSVPHNARIWNYWLGGKDNFAADRQIGDQVLAVYPEIVEVARASRQFLSRVVRFLAGERGIRQFLDIGTGLPTADHTHEVAQRVAPESRVVYVDNDPLVLVHARALLTSSREGATDYLEADVRDPERILKKASRTLDFQQPIAIMMLGILGAVIDYEQARSVVRRLVDAVPAGSYLVINDGTNVINGERRDAATQISFDSGTAYVARTPEEIAGFFEGLKLLDPGVVSTSRWRPELGEGAPGTDEPAEVDDFCGVAEVPSAR